MSLSAISRKYGWMVSGIVIDEALNTLGKRTGVKSSSRASVACSRRKNPGICNDAWLEFCIHWPVSLSHESRGRILTAILTGERFMLLLQCVVLSFLPASCLSDDLVLFVLFLLFGAATCHDLAAVYRFAFVQQRDVGR